MSVDLLKTVADLRRDQSDSYHVEVKAAAGGVPQLADTLCAFGNTPGGGTIILGLDERENFKAVGIENCEAVEEAIASQARGFIEPPVKVTFERAQVDNKQVVVVHVMEQSTNSKPCTTGNQAYLRQADGDYRLSEAEVAQLIALRTRPRHDVRLIDEARLDDLDRQLTPLFAANVSRLSPRLASQDTEEVLFRKRAVDSDGVPTIAGLYALGDYPQRYEPSLSITAGVVVSGQRRLDDLSHFDGPIPDLLESATSWVSRMMRNGVVYAPSGHARDDIEIPLLAVREFIANALVHRDLSHHTSGKRVEIRLTDHELIISNPGGLWGISVDQLGTPAGKSAVNEFLYEMCQNVWTADGRRVIEGEGGGIRAALEALREAGMRPPQFIDQGVRFTVRLSRHSFLAPSDLAWLADLQLPKEIGDEQRQILVSMRHGERWTNARVRSSFRDVGQTEARVLLRALVNIGLVEQRGQGGGTSYGLAALLESRRGGVETQPKLLEGARWTRDHAQQATANGAAIWNAIGEGGNTLEGVEKSSGLSASQVSYGVRQLIRAGAVRRNGGVGRDTTYYRCDK